MCKLYEPLVDARPAANTRTMGAVDSYLSVENQFFDEISFEVVEPIALG